uniref:Uncharacterized protein n=1 Tax=Ditylenchus dipsaci TaxID=166011 RepID=A0A915DAW1_9BILA
MLPEQSELIFSTTDDTSQGVVASSLHILTVHDCVDMVSAPVKIVVLDDDAATFKRHPLNINSAQCKSLPNMPIK